MTPWIIIYMAIGTILTFVHAKRRSVGLRPAWSISQNLFIQVIGFAFWSLAWPIFVFRFSMFRASRALWLTTKAINDVLFLSGSRDVSLANRIISIDKIDSKQLSFHQFFDVYRDRSLRGGVIMQLVQIGAFWLGRSRFAEDVNVRHESLTYYRVVAEAATTLAEKEYWKEANPRETVLKMIETECDASFRATTSF